MQTADDVVTVLLTEDGALINLDLSHFLAEAGYDVVGPATSVAESLRLLKAKIPHLAVIDVALANGPCTDLAQELRRLRVPFLVRSDPLCDAGAMAAFGDGPRVTKPVGRDEILDLLDRLADPARPQ